jgi:polysaccharide biosynthesis transport protein
MAKEGIMVTTLLRRHLPEKHEDRTLSSFFISLYRQKALFIAVVAVIGGAGCVLSLVLSETFQAEGILAVNTQGKQVIDVANVIPDPPRDAGSLWPVVEAEAARLRSAVLAARVVERLKLFDDPEFNRDKIAGQTASSWNNALRSWVASSGEAISSASRRVVKAVVSNVTGNPPARATDGSDGTIVDSFATHVKVTADRPSGLLKVGVSSVDPKKALQLASTMIDEFLMMQVQAKVDANEKAIDWLAGRVAELKREAAASDDRIEEFRAKAHLLRAKGESVATQQLSELNTALIQAEADEVASAARLRRIGNASMPSAMDQSAPEILNSQTITRLRDQEAVVSRSVAEARKTFGPQHPGRRQLEAQLADLREKLANEMLRIRASVSAEVGVAHSRTATLRDRLQQLQSVAAERNADTVMLRQLTLQADANRELYQMFLTRLKQLSMQAQLQQADVVIVSPPVLPTIHSYPNRTQIIGFSFFLALIFGVVLAAGRDRLRSGFMHARQLEQRYGRRVSGVLPVLKAWGASEGKRVPYFERISLLICLEALRSIFSTLMSHTRSHPAVVVLVTSAIPSEGKTTLALALARFAAEAGKRVVIVDCDFLRPSLTSKLGLAGAPGLRDLFGSAASLQEATHVCRDRGFKAIGIGSSGRYTTQMSTTRQLTEIVSMLKRTHDLVIVDSGPVLGSSDTRSWAEVVDRALLAVRWCHTPVPLVDDAVRALHEAGMDPNVVLTQVLMRQYARYDDSLLASYRSRSREATNRTAVILRIAQRVMTL